MFAHIPTFLLFLLVQGNKVKEENPNNSELTCPTDWEKKEDRCYLWSTTRRTWTDAEQFCREKDGHLASVTNLKIHDYIMSKVVKSDHSTWFWVRGTDQEQEGVWKWTDGSDWEFTKWATYPNQQWS